MKSIYTYRDRRIQFQKKQIIALLLLHQISRKRRRKSLIIQRAQITRTNCNLMGFDEI